MNINQLFNLQHGKTVAEEQTLHRVTKRKSIALDPDYGSLSPGVIKAKVQNVVRYYLLELEDKPSEAGRRDQRPKGLHKS